MSYQQSINASNSEFSINPNTSNFNVASGVDKRVVGGMPWAALSVAGGSVAAIASLEKPAEAQMTLGAGSTYSTMPGFNINNPSATSSVFQGSHLTGLYTLDTGTQLEGPTNLTTALSNVTLLETTQGSGVFNFNTVVVPVINTVGGVQQPFNTGESLKAYFFSSAGSSSYAYSVNVSYSLLSTNIGTTTSATTGTPYTVEAIQIDPFTALAGTYAEVAFGFQHDGNLIGGVTGGGIQGSSQTNFKQNVGGSTSESITSINPLAVFMTAGGQAGNANAPEPGSGILLLASGICAAVGAFRKFTAGKI